MTNLLLGIDFGGTKNAVALVAQGKKTWLDSRRQISPPNAGAQHDLDTVLKMSAALLNSHPGELLAVGVSFGGPVDYENGVVKLSHHVAGWENFPLRDHLQNAFNVPVWIDNDANAGALGEWYCGAGAGCSNLFYITVSTGIGGGWIINGKSYRGANGAAGEIGHMIVKPNGPKCICGKAGCLEALACGPAIAAQAAKHLATATGLGKKLRHLCKNDLTRIRAEMVSQAANAGDKLAQEVLREAARYLGMGIGQALALMNPERVVLGGGVSKAGTIYWQEVRRTAAKYAPPETAVNIVSARFVDEAPLWGAVTLASQQFSNQG